MNFVTNLIINYIAAIKIFIFNGIYTSNCTKLKDYSV
jgi:hypothetical protein